MCNRNKMHRKCLTYFVNKNEFATAIACPSNIVFENLQFHSRWLKAANQTKVAFIACLKAPSSESAAPQTMS